MANSSIFELGDFFALDSPLTPPDPAPVNFTIVVLKVEVVREFYTIFYRVTPLDASNRRFSITISLRGLADRPAIATFQHTLAGRAEDFKLVVAAQQLVQAPGAKLEQLSFSLVAASAAFSASSGLFHLKTSADALQADEQLARAEALGYPVQVPNARASQALLEYLPDLSAWRELLNNKVPPSTVKEIAARNAAYQAMLLPRGKAEIQPRDKPFYIQTLESGAGQINLDYYPVLITKKPHLRDAAGRLTDREMTAEQFYQYIRQNINNVINPASAHFDAYTDADGDQWRPNPKPVAARLPNPQQILNTIFSIPLGGIRIPWEYVPDFAKKLYEKYNEPVTYYRPDHGAVIASVSTPLYWRFTTIATARDLEHAICGTREFGVKRTEEGYIFYVRGVDRPASLVDVFGNEVVPRQLMGGSADANDRFNLIWDGADHLWRSMQAGVQQAVRDLGGEASFPQDPHLANRYEWEAVKRKYIRA